MKNLNIREIRAVKGIPSININHARLSRELALGACGTGSLGRADI